MTRVETRGMKNEWELPIVVALILLRTAFDSSSPSLSAFPFSLPICCNISLTGNCSKQANMKTTTTNWNKDRNFELRSPDVVAMCADEQNGIKSTNAQRWFTSFSVKCVFSVLSFFICCCCCCSALTYSRTGAPVALNNIGNLFSLMLLPASHFLPPWHFRFVFFSSHLCVDWESQQRQWQELHNSKTISAGDGTLAENAQSDKCTSEDITSAQHNTIDDYAKQLRMRIDDCDIWAELGMSSYGRHSYARSYVRIYVRRFHCIVSHYHCVNDKVWCFHFNLCMPRIRGARCADCFMKLMKNFSISNFTII